MNINIKSNEYEEIYITLGNNIIYLNSFDMKVENRTSTIYSSGRPKFIMPSIANVCSASIECKEYEDVRFFTNLFNAENYRDKCADMKVYSNGRKIELHNATPSGINAYDRTVELTFDYWNEEIESISTKAAVETDKYDDYIIDCLGPATRIYKEQISEEDVIQNYMENDIINYKETTISDEEMLI